MVNPKTFIFYPNGSKLQFIILPMQCLFRRNLLYFNKYNLLNKKPGQKEISCNISSTHFHISHILHPFYFAQDNNFTHNFMHNFKLEVQSLLGIIARIRSGYVNTYPYKLQAYPYKFYLHKSLSSAMETGPATGVISCILRTTTTTF